MVVVVIIGQLNKTPGGLLIDSTGLYGHIRSSGSCNRHCIRECLNVFLTNEIRKESLMTINEAARVFATIQSRGYRVESELWRESMATNLKYFRKEQRKCKRHY